MGILYYWGMPVPDDYESIQWYPYFMNLSLSEESEFDIVFTDLKAYFREVAATDLKGRLYFCDMN